MAKKLETDFEDADESPGLMLWRVNNAWQASIRAALRPFDLTHVQFVLLAALTWLDAETPITQRDIAEYARTDPMMTSQVVRTLESKGFVERRPHPTDARARSVVVTQAGAALAGKANRAVEASDREFFAALGDRQAAFVAMLGALDRR
ncbi:MarR family winged helix-turn-helix transcriptional regulator [Rhodococcus sp. NPDC056516]|uniref:MarR family winged helix-turn-helix transcriptional regulator n=1 Tax=Rhodococcus sp. NPDC056516 TaxID=3345847 RepID=UPI00366D71E2